MNHITDLNFGAGSKGIKTTFNRCLWKNAVFQDSVKIEKNLHRRGGRKMRVVGVHMQLDTRMSTST